jgi:hypothetical protein
MSKDGHSWVRHCFDTDGLGEIASFEWRPLGEADKNIFGRRKRVTPECRK